MNPKFLFIFSITILSSILILSCGENDNTYQSKETEKKVEDTNSVDNEVVVKNNKLKEEKLDTLLLNLDDNEALEKITIYKGDYEMSTYKFEIYNNSSQLIDDVYSYNPYPWIDSLENNLNLNKILWQSFYSNGSDMGGKVYRGYKIMNNEIVDVISIPDNYYGSFNIGDPNANSFEWGNIKLLHISYTNDKVIVTVQVDYHTAPSWKEMHTSGKTVYKKNHKLVYTWIKEKQEYLVKSLKIKDSAYHIENIYDMTAYLEIEFGVTW